LEVIPLQLQQAIDDFLLYLEVEQNYSPLTIRSYDYDLASFGFSCINTTVQRN
jgi:site-specific recombinase XerD